MALTALIGTFIKGNANCINVYIPIVKNLKNKAMNSSTLVGVVICATPLVLIIATIIVRGKKLFD